MDRQYAAFVDEFLKIAEVDAVTDPASVVQPDEQTAPIHREHPALTIAKGVGGFALGAGLGAGGMYLANKATHALTGNNIPKSVLTVAAPIATGAAGLGLSYLQHRMLQRIQPEPANERVEQGTGV